MNIIVAGHELQSDEIAHLAVRGQATAREATDHLLNLGHRNIDVLLLYKEESHPAKTEKTTGLQDQFRKEWRVRENRWQGPSR